MLSTYVGRSRAPRRAGIVGVVGLLATVFAAVLQSNPELRATVAAVAGWLVDVIFRVSAVLGFLVGLSVILYSYWKQSRGATTERAHRLTAMGVLATFVLFFGVTLVVVEDIALFVLGLSVAVGPGLPPRLWFYGGLALFGALTLVGLVDTCLRRLRSRGAD